MNSFSNKDDLFDYANKRLENQEALILKKKMTLPLIKSLENASAKDKNGYSIKKFINKKVVRKIIDYVKNTEDLITQFK